MPDPPPTVALFYDDDAYVEVRHDPARPRDADQPLGLMGRQVAGREFLSAYLDHGSWTELVALVRDRRSAESLKRLWREQPWSRRGRSLRIVDERRFHDAFLRDPPATLLHLPCPPDSRYAWSRRASAPHAFALSGVTHTLCSLEAARQICDYVTAPFEPYDVLVCTSSAVIAMVRQVADAYKEYLRDRMGSRPALGLRLAHIPLGVDTDRFRPASPAERAEERRSLGIADEEVAVLFVGRLSHHAKAHPFPMFEGLARAAQQAGRAVHLVLSGWAVSPAVRAAFVEGARLFAPGIRATFIDGEDPRHRFSVWRAADLFCSLADNIQETFGLVVVEAMACGLPVVASDWDGYRDLVVDGETGLLVPTAMIVGATSQTTARLILGEVDYDHFLAECSQATAVDVTAAAAAFRRLLDDPDRRRAMGEAGRRRALELFTWPRVIARYQRLWAEQDELRREYRERGGTMPARGGPPLYPEPERSFQGYPSVWLDAADDLRSDPAAPERLGTFLNTPLTHHVGGRRHRDPATLAEVLNAASRGCSIADLDLVLRRAGADHRTGRATLAWLLKYGLLEVAASPASLPPSSADEERRTAGLGEGPRPRPPDTGPRICFVTACMGRLAHLRQTLGLLVAQPDCSCVVVDYSCPERSGEWVAAHFPSIRVVRLEGRTEFHRSEARNRGADLADAPWICFVDADVRVAANFAEVVRPRLQPGCFYCPDPFAEGTEGTFLCSRGDFERAGGFDEVLQGWGEEDNDLYDALEFLGVRRATYPVALLHHLPHGEDQRGRFHAIEPGLSHAINRVYRILKWDTAKLRGRLLTMPMRQNLYRTVREVVTTTLAEDRAGDLRVQLPYGIVPGGWTLPRSLVYQLVRGRGTHRLQSGPSRPEGAAIPDDGGRPAPGPVTGGGDDG